MRRGMDASFSALPLRSLADAALGRAAELGAAHASFRLDRVRTARLLLRDGVLGGGQDTTDTGLAVRLWHRGVPGFAAAPELTASAAAGAAEQAVAVARACAAIGGGSGEPVGEPVHRDTTWISSYRVDPFEVPEQERIALMADRSRRLLAAPEVEHVLAFLTLVRENKFYADLAGTVTAQQRIRVHPLFFVQGADPRGGGTATLRTLGPPVARGWEYLGGEGWDWERELAELPAHLAAKLRARPVRPGRYDLVIDPSNLWLTVHESVGHTTEMDRALGHEASSTGTTFLAPDGLGSHRYGSPLMNVTADRTAEHGLATVGFDDEGVAAQSWSLVRDGVLTGFQHDRRTAGLAGLGRSNGCSFAESAMHVPLPRMPNVGLRPAPGGPSTGDLIAGVEDGIYLVGSDSWSIDMRRQNFQMTAQRCHRIRNGRLDGQLSGVAYQASTTRFWSALTALGGEDTYRLFGADLCGKGQPMQVAAASHGCPAAVFEGVEVIDTGAEGLA
ncbi:TldD/PmbA family protein [Actinomadura verrucosospora]